MDVPAITFGEIRKRCSRIDRISVCNAETTAYENFQSIRDVPHTYDAWYVWGIGGIESEFQEEGRMALLPCLEFLVLEQLRTKETEARIWKS